MSKHADVLLRELASAGEPVRAVLERAGLDYCCRGEEPLERACALAGLDVHAVERELESVAPEPAAGWARRDLTELIDHVVGVLHARTHGLFDELLAARAELPRHDARARAVRDAIDALVAHAELQMSEEEQVLYPRARALAEARKGRGAFPVVLRSLHDHRARLREGHAATHALLRRARALAAELPAPLAEPLCARLDAVTRAVTEQMHLENNELIPRALDLEPNGKDPR